MHSTSEQAEPITVYHFHVPDLLQLNAILSTGYFPQKQRIPVTMQETTNHIQWLNIRAILFLGEMNKLIERDNRSNLSQFNRTQLKG